MATNYYHPGIYIQEVPSARTIQGASTSTPAFIGVTETGPINTPTLITSWNAYQRVFGNMVWNGMVSWAVYQFFALGGALCYVSRVPDTAGTGKQATASAGTLKLTAVTPGTWPNNVLGFVISNANGPDTAVSPVFNLSIVIDPAALPGITATSASATLGAYVLQNNLTPQPLNGKSYYVLETYNGYTAETASTALAAAINANSIFARATITGTGRPGNSKAATPFTAGAAPTWDFSSSFAPLQTVQDISLLAMPDTVNMSDQSGTPSLTQQVTTINLGLNYCEQQASLFYVTDPPYGLDVQNMVAFRSGSTKTPALNSTYGAIYYPWVWIANPVSGASVPIPPSGPALGRYANTDSSVGVWKSPAGVNDGSLKTVVMTDLPLTDADQDVLNPDGINAIRNLIGYGNVIYGARTLAAAGSEWTYVSVRRLFIYVEQSLKQSLQWVVFEPNDQTTWSAVTRDIDAFLTTLWQAGGLFGAKASEAFFVVCDASNNPPETRALGQMYIDIGLAPVYPAEFVIIRIAQKTAGPDSGS
ncbi:phage tail sheath family protein [Burkholderia sp. Ap-962]|uniref:phage tail sheath C-terminal domain-containing protein n=1 Tax=Burkholderia sp. Ap-962 TaxID=2608333 RepID=UPI0014239753|nr:phage tail sheath C-terminal domain-containing protein [Burkholderia sp. Ap-962]NIF75204.1 phage tail sheath family protein [Burkholderia sp. Ap-962]